MLDLTQPLGWLGELTGQEAQRSRAAFERSELYAAVLAVIMATDQLRPATAHGAAAKPASGS